MAGNVVTREVLYDSVPAAGGLSIRKRFILKNGWFAVIEGKPGSLPAQPGADAAVASALATLTVKTP